MKPQTIKTIGMAIQLIRQQVLTNCHQEHTSIFWKLEIAALTQYKVTSI